MTRVKDNIPTSEVVASLFQLAHDLMNAGGDSSDPARLKEDLRSAGGTLWQHLVAMNDGRDSTGKSSS